MCPTICLHFDPSNEILIRYKCVFQKSIKWTRLFRGRKKRSTDILIHYSWSSFETYSFTWLIFEARPFTWSVFHLRDRQQGGALTERGRGYVTSTSEILCPLPLAPFISTEGYAQPSLTTSLWSTNKSELRPDVNGYEINGLTRLGHKVKYAT